MARSERKIRRRDDQPWHPDNWPLTTRTHNCLLNNAGIDDVRRLLETPDSELLRIGNFGLKSLDEVREIRDLVRVRLGGGEAVAIMHECETF